VLYAQDEKIPKKFAGVKILKSFQEVAA